MTKHEAIMQFCGAVTDRLDTTKATVRLDKTDLMINCNTSAFKGLETIRNSLTFFHPYRRYKEVNELRDEAINIIKKVRVYFALYGNHFKEWWHEELEYVKKRDPNFHKDLYCLQKLQREYENFYQMIEEYEKVQGIFRNFSADLQKRLNVLEPSEFETSRQIKIKQGRKKSVSASYAEGTNSSGEESSSNEAPTMLEKITVKNLKLNFGVISMGLSRSKGLSKSVSISSLADLEETSPPLSKSSMNSLSLENLQ